MVMAEIQEGLGYGNSAEEVVLVFIRDLRSRIRWPGKEICESYEQYGVLCCWPSFSRGKYRMRHPLQTERQSLFEQRNGVLLLFMRKDPPRTNNSYKALIAGSMHGPSTDTIRLIPNETS